MKRDPLDALFSNYVRSRDSYTCQRCKKYYEPPTRAIHAAHIFSRRHRGVRWDPENAIALCHGCHTFFTGDPEYFTEWVENRIGSNAYNLLKFKARKTTKYTKFDLSQIRKELKAKLASLKCEKRS